MIFLQYRSVNANITNNNVTTFGVESHGIVLGDNESNAIIISNIVTTNGIESYGIILNEIGTNGSISLNNVTTSETGAHGILLGENGTNTNITSNTVATSGEDASGIKMADGSSGLVYNNTVTVTGNWSTLVNTAMGGIWLESNTFDINVSSNNITMSGYDNAGIWAWSCSNHSIENNNITTSGVLGDGIYLNDVQGINLTSNAITLSGSSGDGIHSEMSENFTLIFYNNLITTSGDYSYGINLNQDSYNNISSNNITTSGDYSYGLFLNQSHNTTMVNNRVVTGAATSYVLYLITSSNQSVYNNIFNTSTTGSGVYIEDSDLNYFNTTNTTSINIMGRTYTGGNFWTNNNGNGYSDRCINLDNDYFCDSAYVVVIGMSHTDYLPLANHVSWVPACTTLNIENKSYYLNQSISSNRTCFNITANGIILDFNGYNITGNTTGYGVNVTNYNDTTILDGFIYNFSIGIYLENNQNNNITNMTSNNNNLHGITFSTSSNNTLTTITVNNNSAHGINFTNSNDSTLVSVVANSNTLLGLYLDASSSNTFTSFNISDSGINLNNASSNIFTNFNISDSATDAIVLEGSTSDNNNFTTVTVTNTNLSFYDINFSTAGIDGTWIIGINFANYSFAGAGGKVNFEEPSFGKIEFLEAINGSGASLSTEVDVESNSIFVNSSSNSGLNKSANITLYSVSYTDPKPQYSLSGSSTYTDCTSSTNPSCTELSYNSTTDIYIFNVSHFTYFKTAEGYSAPDDSTSSSSSSGGVTPTFWTAGTYVITQEVFEKGITYELPIRKRIKFPVEGVGHYIGIIELTATIATINVSSTPQQAVLIIGDIRRFDVTDDGFYDINVTLNGISNGKANITLLSIHEEITDKLEQEQENDADLLCQTDENCEAGYVCENGYCIKKDASSIPKEESSLLWLWILIIVVLVIAIILFVIFKAKKRF